MEPSTLREIMNQHCGTEEYHRDMYCIITDGMKDVMEQAKAGWLVSDIGAVMKIVKAVQGHGIVFWVLEVKEDKTATLECKQDIPGKTLYKQKYDFTDFPAGEWKFYFSEGVLFLPSEY